MFRLKWKMSVYSVIPCKFKTWYSLHSITGSYIQYVHVYTSLVTVSLQDHTSMRKSYFSRNSDLKMKYGFLGLIDGEYIWNVCFNCSCQKCFPPRACFYYHLSSWSSSRVRCVLIGFQKCWNATKTLLHVAGDLVSARKSVWSTDRCVGARIRTSYLQHLRRRSCMTTLALMIHGTTESVLIAVKP